MWKRTSSSFSGAMRGSVSIIVDFFPYTSARAAEPDHAFYAKENSAPPADLSIYAPTVPNSSGRRCAATALVHPSWWRNSRTSRRAGVLSDASRPRLAQRGVLYLSLIWGSGSSKHTSEPQLGRMEGL